MSATALWATVVAASVLSYLTKAAGFVVPARWLSSPRVARTAALLPVALLAALVATQAFTDASGRFVVDARAAGVAAAVVALLVRAPFLVVVALAAGVAALVRARGWLA